MELLVTRYKPWIMIILLVLLVSFAIYRWWQGPLLPSYEVVSSPLIQTVVASGRVVKLQGLFLSAWFKREIGSLEGMFF